MKTFSEWLSQKNEGLDLADLRAAAKTATPVAETPATGISGAVGTGGQQSKPVTVLKKKPIKPEVGSEKTGSGDEMDLNHFKKSK